jgi:prophage regulatory protein
MPRVLRRPEVEARTGVENTTIWRKVKAGTFPQPIQLGPNSIGWIDEEVDAWIASRPRGTVKLGPVKRAEKKPAA